MRVTGPVLGFFAAGLLACGTGCGGGGTTTAPGEGGGTPTAKEGLTDLVALLKHLEDGKKPPPKKAADIEPIEPVFPGAYLAITRGDVVYMWGTPLSPSGTGVVLAFEKKAEAGGGWVLMQDGTVKEMSAAELAAAPRAGKK